MIGRRRLVRERLSCLLFISSALVLASGARAQEHEDSIFDRFYQISFNRHGELLNPEEIQVAIDGLRKNKDVDRIFIISYGWSNDGERSVAAYHAFITGLEQAAARVEAESTMRRRPSSHVAAIAVGWDSSFSGFRKLFNDLLPLPFLADALAFIPDNVLFPVSFWSKAATADRIGMGGLREALNQVFSQAYPEGTRHPDLVLVGHSFGTRIVSGLMQEKLGIFPVRNDPFISRDQVAAAMLLQPAAIQSNLHLDAQYPVMVTLSRHDHANGFLFPVANLPLSAFAFTLSEGLVRQRFFDPLNRGVDAVTEAVTAPLPARAGLPPTAEKPVSYLRYRVVRTLGEIAAVPAAFAFSIVTLPIGYAYTQGSAFLSHPFSHVMDTLAQLPLVEVPVYGLDRALGHEVLWGERCKGLFTLSPLHESAGRMIAPRFFPPRAPAVYSPGELGALAITPGPCRLPTCRGVFAVDAASIVREGLFGDLERPWRDFTLGWLDPLGSHADYKNEGIAKLMFLLSTGTDRMRFGVITDPDAPVPAAPAPGP